MKKSRVCIPIIAIPLIVITIFLAAAITEYNSVDGAMKPEKELAKYLKKEHGVKYKNINLIDSTETTEIRGGGSCDGSTVNTFNPNNRIYYYTVYSDEDDVEFFATLDKKRAAIDYLSCQCREPGTEVTDNLEESKNLKRLNAAIEKAFNKKVDTTYEIADKSFNVIIDDTLTINHNLTREDYNTLMQLKNEIASYDLNISEGAKSYKSGSVHYYTTVKIKFSNAELTLDIDKKDFYTKDSSHRNVYLSDSSFNTFVGE